MRVADKDQKREEFGEPVRLREASQEKSYFPVRHLRMPSES